MSKLFKASLVMAIFFAINKVVALVRQYLIAKQFGLSAEIDAFNVSNNIPDLLFSIIAGSALALAFIPVLTEYFDARGKKEAWLLFARVTNIVFLTTAVLAAVVAIFALPLITSPLGIAPGFSPAQQQLTVELMRLNLIATVIFSISGLIMSGLHAKRHFFLPALAPILYNVGQIIGITVVAPVFGVGVHGLAYGVIIGSILHICVQIPALVHYGFFWKPTFGFSDEGVRRVLKLMGPRILTVVFIQIIFLSRDNLASHLEVGSVSALTYGYYILQVPETLIGTALGTALLPTLAEFAADHHKAMFREVLNKTTRVMFALTMIITTITLFGLAPLTTALFNFGAEKNELLVWVTNAYMIGLFTQSLLEVTTRAFYARQDARTPFLFTFVRMAICVVLSVLLSRSLGAVGLALADTISVSCVVVYSIFLLNKQFPGLLKLGDTQVRTLSACGVVAVLLIASKYIPYNSLITTLVAIAIGGSVALWLVRKELQLLLKL